MKEYVRGAFQALAWVRMLLSNVKDTAGLEKALIEIDQALEKVKTTAAKDFKQDITAELEVHEKG